MPFVDIPKLPPAVWDVEFRERLERRLDKDFSEAADDQTTYRFSRARVGLTSQQRGLKIRVQYQYAQSVQWKDGSADDVVIPRSDLLEAYAEGQAGDWKLKGGRFRWQVGAGRLIASPDWGYSGRSYDGVLADRGPLRLFATRVAVNSTYNHEQYLLGGIHKTKQGQTMVVYHESPRESIRKSLWTLNHIVNGAVGGWKILGEGALQVGRSAGKEVSAAGFLVEGSRPVGKAKLTLEAAWASGGESADHSRVFDPLFPQFRCRMGYMDMQGWRNTRYLAAFLEGNVSRNTSGTFLLASSWLEDPSDYWYGSSGKPNKGASGSFRDVTGQSGRDLGYETALEFSHVLRKDLTLTLGGARFAPGGFVRERNGGSADPQYLGWVQLHYKM